MPSDEAGPADPTSPAAASSAAAIDTASALPAESLELGEITGDQRLRLAKQLLIFVGLYCVASFAAYAALPQNGPLGQIFEFTKIGVLPLVTLVVSFYFPKARA